MDRQETSLLLRRARDGVPGAFDDLLQRCAGRLLALIRIRMGRSLRARLESRDILQATLLKSFEHFQDFESSDAASLMSWLARIAQNEIRDQADRQARGRRDVRAEVPIESAAGRDANLVAASLRSALSQLVIDERVQRLEQAIDALDLPHREAILLRHFEELSFRQIGARLGRSEDAARMLYARAVANLTMRMSSDGS